MGEKLKGDLAGYYKLKFPPYRIIYKIYHNQLMIFIVKVAHRQNAYK